MPSSPSNSPSPQPSNPIWTPRHCVTQALTWWISTHQLRAATSASDTEYAAQCTSTIAFLQITQAQVPLALTDEALEHLYRYAIAQSLAMLAVFEARRARYLLPAPPAWTHVAAAARVVAGLAALHPGAYGASTVRASALDRWPAGMRKVVKAALLEWQRGFEGRFAAEVAALTARGEGLLRGFRAQAERGGQVSLTEHMQLETLAGEYAGLVARVGKVEAEMVTRVFITIPSSATG